MKSGLEDRNNADRRKRCFECLDVSMKSGLEDRNNLETIPNLTTGDLSQ